MTNLKQILSLSIKLAIKDQKERYAKSSLGPFWMIAWPLTNLIIYTIVFGKFMGAKLPGQNETFSYSIYLASGLIPWIAFSNSLTRSCTTFLDNKHIITKTTVPLQSFPLFVIFSETITLFISFVLFFIFVAFFGVIEVQCIPFFILTIFIQILLSCGLAFILSTITVFIRDTKDIMGIGLQLLFWLNPIVYVPLILPKTINSLLSLQPTYILVESYHSCFTEQDISFLPFVYLCGIAILALIAGSAILNRFESDIRDCL